MCPTRKLLRCGAQDFLAPATQLTAGAFIFKPNPGPTQRPKGPLNLQDIWREIDWQTCGARKLMAVILFWKRKIPFLRGRRFSATAASLSCCW